MRPIIEYNNYRRYIQDFYEEKKKMVGFSWRDFARAAKFSSPVFLKLVCDGKSGLSDDAANRVAYAMDLAGFEFDYFMALVRFNQAKTDIQRDEAFTELKEIAKAHKVNILGADLYTYFSSWKYAALRELAPAMQGAKPNHLAKQCLPEISSEEVVKALQFLTSAKLLRRTTSIHNYQQTEKSVATGPLDIATPAVRSFHRQMGELALNTLDKVPVAERNFSTLTLGLTENSYQKILKELANFRRKVIAIATNEDDVERVYELNLQLFPLTKKISEKKFTAADERTPSTAEEKQEAKNEF